MIIVTGGAGFIGSNLVRGLNELGRNDIVIVDNLGHSEKFKNLIGLRYLDYIHKNDFLEKLELNYFSDDIQVIFHEGACSDTMEYDCNYMMSNNYEYSKKLLHFALGRTIPFLYASSAATYGSGERGFIEGDFCEGALNIYAFSKLAFDRYVRQIMPQVESQIVGLKYFNVFGPQEHHKGKMASIVYQLYNQLKQSNKVKLFKGIDDYQDGEQKRDFVYVKDLVKVNLTFWQEMLQSGIYNCGTGQARSFNDVAKSLIHLHGIGEIEYIDFPDILRGKYQNFTEADLTSLRTAGYNASFYSLEEAITDYVNILQRDQGYYQL